MSRFLPLLQRTVVLPVSLASLCLGVAVQGQPRSSPGPQPTGEVPTKDAPSSVPAPTPSPNPRIQRYKINVLSVNGPAINSWIVFYVIEGTTIILMKLATNYGLKWWDHPVLSGKACQIIQADGGERLVDCLRAASSVPGQPPRIVLPQSASLHDYLLTFTWEESGRIQDGMIRIDQTMKPDVIAPPRVQPRIADSRSWRYKVKLSPGNAWQNLKPESWVVLDVIRGTTITLKQSTNSYNLITGFSRWWDHPIRSITACPLYPSEGSDRPAGCLQGSSAGPREPFRIVLPEGTSLHDYRFTFTWEESGRTQEGVTIVDRMLQPTPVPSP